MKRRGQIIGNTAGFTLIELLVGLALMGMIAALLLQSLQAAGTLARRERGRSGDLDALVGAQRIIRTRIERLRTVTRLDSALPIVDARGTAESFTFVAPPPDRIAPSALQRFKLARTANGMLLLYSASTRNIEVDRNGIDLTGWTPTVILRGIASLSLTYFGGDTAGSHSWQSRWSDRAQPPELIRVRVVFPAGDRRFWPDLIVRPRATIEHRCNVDPLTGDCRIST